MEKNDLLAFLCESEGMENQLKEPSFFGFAWSIPPWLLFDLSSDCATLEEEFITIDVHMLSPSMGGMFLSIGGSLFTNELPLLSLQLLNDSLQELSFPKLTPTFPWFDPVEPSVFLSWMPLLSSHRKGSLYLQMNCNGVELSLKGLAHSEMFRKKGVVKFCYCIPFHCSDWYNLICMLNEGFNLGDLIISFFFPGLLLSLDLGDTRKLANMTHDTRQVVDMS